MFFIQVKVHLRLIRSYNLNNSGHRRSDFGLNVNVLYISMLQDPSTCGYFWSAIWNVGKSGISRDASYIGKESFDFLLGGGNIIRMGDGSILNCEGKGKIYTVDIT